MRVEVKVVGRINVSKDSCVVLDHAHLRGEEYVGRKLMKFTAIGSHLERCRFDNARFDDASFGSGREMSEYSECSFDGVHFLHGGGYARFVRCSFRDVDLRNWSCRAVEMVDCVFTGRMMQCIFNGTVPVEQRPFVGRERNEFHGNDFSGMDLVDVAFRSGIDLTQQRLPTGPEYLYLPDAAAALAKARSVVVGWQEPEMRDSALLTLRGPIWEAENGQRQLLLRADDYYLYGASTPEGRADREAVDKLFSLLRSMSA